MNETFQLNDKKEPEECMKVANTEIRNTIYIGMIMQMNHACMMKCNKKIATRDIGNTAR
jgi:hypothetical protein